MNPEKILEKYCQRLDKEKYKALLAHGKQVAICALEITEKHPGLSADKMFLEEAGMLHDIGVCALKPGDNYIQHGVYGRKILEKEGLSKHALVCERHVGAGISKKEVIEEKMPLPKRDMLPQTIEEKIICYADKFYSKSKKDKHGIEDILKKMQEYGKEQYKRFQSLHRLFS